MVTMPVSLHAGGCGSCLASSKAPARTPLASSSQPAVPVDRADISAAAQQQATAAGEPETAEPARPPGGDTGLPMPGALSEMDPEARRAIASLRRRDQEVRLHEQAHLLAAGPYATGGPSYTYATGPDGRRYAVGGEVPIDLSAVPGDPQATLQKARTLRRAALAPTHPSGADLAIAMQATALAAQAQQELVQIQRNDPAATPAPTAIPGAAQAKTTRSSTEPETTPTASATSHICGPDCQINGTRLAPDANMSASRPPLTIATQALQMYQVAADTGLA